MLELKKKSGLRNNFRLGYRFSLILSFGNRAQFLVWFKKT